jgi:hypothetical protein
VLLAESLPGLLVFSKPLVEGIGKLYIPKKIFAYDVRFQFAIDDGRNRKWKLLVGKG